MLYCEKCRRLCDTNPCPQCGEQKLRTPEENDIVYLISGNETWSNVMEEILHENGIPCLKEGGRGTSKGGNLERTCQLFVPFGAYEKSKELLSNFSSSDSL